jgi:hypothetical protein
MGLSYILLFSLIINYSGSFREGDWVTYDNFRFVTSVAQDLTYTYFGTTGGVIRYDRFAKRWLDPMTVTDGIPDMKIDNIAYDPDYDRLWVTTPSGDAYYQPTFQRWYNSSDFPLGLARNDFHVGSYPLLTMEFGYMYQNGRINDQVFRSYQITKGVDDGFFHLYIGTWGLGAGMISTRYGQLDLLRYGPFNDDISAFVRAGNTFWMGTEFTNSDDPGITCADTSLQEWHWYVPQYTDGLASANLTCALDDKKAVWLGTDYGVVRYDKNDDRFTAYGDFASLPSLEVSSLAADSAWVYVGTDNGLGAINRHIDRKKTNKSELDSLARGVSNPLPDKNRLIGWHINALRIIDNYLYVGTNRGALRRVIDTYGDFEILNTPEKMLSDDILDIAKNGDSLLFLTKNDIIVIDTKSGAASTLTDLSCFGSWRLRKFSVDDDRIWAASDIGLWMYRFSDGYSRLFTANDGLISVDIRTIEIVGNYIWMATPKGIVRFLWNRPGRLD